MIVYAYGFWHVCHSRLAPVVAALRKKGVYTVYENTWRGIQPQLDFSDFLTAKDKRVFLLACDWNLPAHIQGVSRVQQVRDWGGISVSIQHGEMLPSDPPPTADIQCVWGEYYLKEGLTNPHITGNPYLDDFDKLIREPHTALFTAPTHLAGLVNGSRDLYKDQVRRVAKEMSVRMRPHLSNGEDMAWYHHLEGVARLADNTTELLLELARSRMVFGYSSVMIEAAVLGIPVMEVRDNPTDKVDNQIYYHHSTPLEQVVQRTYSDFAHLHNGGLAGQATNKIVRIIEEAS